MIALGLSLWRIASRGLNDPTLNELKPLTLLSHSMWFAEMILGRAASKLNNEINL